MANLISEFEFDFDLMCVDFILNYFGCVKILLCYQLPSLVLLRWT